MSSPRNTEPQANYELGRALRRRNPDWTNSTVHAERTNVIEESVPGTGTGKKPDILIAPPRRQPVIVGNGVRPCSHGRARRERQAGDELAQHWSRH